MGNKGSRIDGKKRKKGSGRKEGDIEFTNSWGYEPPSKNDRSELRKSAYSGGSMRKPNRTMCSKEFLERRRSISGLPTEPPAPVVAPQNHVKEERPVAPPALTIVPLSLNVNGESGASVASFNNPLQLPPPPELDDGDDDLAPIDSPRSPPAIPPPPASIPAASSSAPSPTATSSSAVPPTPEAKPTGRRLPPPPSLVKVSPTPESNGGTAALRPPPPPPAIHAPASVESSALSALPPPRPMPPPNTLSPDTGAARPPSSPRMHGKTMPARPISPRPPEPAACPAAQLATARSAPARPASPNPAVHAKPSAGASATTRIPSPRSSSLAKPPAAASPRILPATPLAASSSSTALASSVTSSLSSSTSPTTPASVRARPVPSPPAAASRGLSASSNDAAANIRQKMGGSSRPLPVPPPQAAHARTGADAPAPSPSPSSTQRRAQPLPPRSGTPPRAAEPPLSASAASVPSASANPGESGAVMRTPSRRPQPPPPRPRPMPVPEPVLPAEGTAAKIEKAYATCRIHDHYVLGDVVGRGAFSEVVHGTCKSTGQVYAVKIINKELMSQCDGDALRTEIEIMHKVKHPNILSLVDTYETEENTFLVLELMKGGELLYQISEEEAQDGSNYTENDARRILTQIVRGIEHLHQHNIVHRDMKPENILFTDKQITTADLKLIDFGMAKELVEGEKLSDFCGTPEFQAPEIIKRLGYGKEVDMWAVGVILYILLCGQMPFKDANRMRMYSKAVKGEYDLSSSPWDTVSAEAKDLVRQLVCVEVNKRLTAQGCLSHPWLASGQIVPIKRSQSNLGVQFSTNLKHLNQKRLFQQRGNAILNSQKLRVFKEAEEQENKEALTSAKWS